jgi:hypothetical protein
LRVLHTPRHANDHVALFLEQEGALFTGHNALRVGTTVFQDLHAYLKSLQRMAAVRPASTPATGQSWNKAETCYISQAMSSLLSRARPLVNGGVTLENFTRTIYPETLIPTSRNVTRQLGAGGAAEGRAHSEEGREERWALTVPLDEALREIR